MRKPRVRLSWIPRAGPTSSAPEPRVSRPARDGGSLGELAPPERGDVRRPTFDGRDVGSRTSNVEDADILAEILGTDFAERFDRFELAQLREVAAACRESRTAAEAGKRLFAVSRKAKKTSNDTDRLAKYLAKFGLSFKALAARPS